MHDDGLGPGSLLWRYVGDRRYLFLLPRAVTLQLLHPGIAAGITDHALQREQIWLHKKRTVTQAVAIAYSDRDMSPAIRFAHEHVKGHDRAGRRYHALDPDLFHFQHATYVESLVVAVDTFMGGLDPTDREQLYQDCRAWYLRYGISARAMPADWPQFAAYFEDYCRTELSAGPHFEPFRAQLTAPTDWWPQLVPRAAIRAMQHDRAQELTGVAATAADRRALRVFAAAMRPAAALPRLRWAPAARFARSTAKTA